MKEKYRLERAEISRKIWRNPKHRAKILRGLRRANTRDRKNKTGRFSEECSEKLSKALLGHSVSKETRFKMSKAAKARAARGDHPCIGYKPSKKTRKKMSLAASLRGSAMTKEGRESVSRKTMER